METHFWPRRTVIGVAAFIKNQNIGVGWQPPCLCHPSSAGPVWCPFFLNQVTYLPPILWRQRHEICILHCSRTSLQSVQNANKTATWSLSMVLNAIFVVLDRRQIYFLQQGPVWIVVGLKLTQTWKQSRETNKSPAAADKRFEQKQRSFVSFWFSCHQFRPRKLAACCCLDFAPSSCGPIMSEYSDKLRSFQL